MSNIQRRHFLATGAIAIPSIAIAKGITLDATRLDSQLDTQFADCMMQTGQHLKTMRGFMRNLDAPGARPDTIFYANQVTILLAQCIEHAEQAPIPERSKGEYKGDTERFANDLRLKLTQAVAAANALTQAALEGDDAEAAAQYNALRNLRKEGHDEFEEE
jgi:hypothetical protein